MSSPEAHHSPAPPTQAPEQQGPAAEGMRDVSGTGTAAPFAEGAAKPSRVFKMSDEFLMFKFKVSIWLPRRASSSSARAASRGREERDCYLRRRQADASCLFSSSQQHPR